MNEGRDPSLDLVRVVATVMVVMLHVSATTWGAVGPEWIADNTYDSLVRLCVPLFFMVSGALLIPRDDGLRSILLRALRLAIPLVFWSVVYAIWTAVRAGTPIGDTLIPTALKILAGPPVAGHLWFLYSMIGLYLALPVLQAFFRATGLDKHLWFLGLCFLGASLIPMATAFAGAPWRGIDFAYFPLFAGYAVAGAVLRSSRPALLVAAAWLLMAVALGLVTALATYWLTLESGKPSQRFYSYGAPVVVLASVAAFMGLRGLPVAPFRVLRFLAAQTFGVYLVHILVMFYVSAWGLHVNVASHWLTIPAQTLAVFTISAVMVSILRLIPGGRLIAPG